MFDPKFISTWKKGQNSSFGDIQFPLPRDVLCQVSLKLGYIVFLLEKKEVC